MTKHLLPLLLILAACTPAPSQPRGLVAAPSAVVVTAAPDVSGALYALQGTATAQTAATEQVRAAATAQAQQTAQAWERSRTETAEAIVVGGATATAASIGTATAQAESVSGTATALAAPAVFATQTTIRNQTALEIRRSVVSLSVEPYRQWGLLFGEIALLIGLAVGLSAFLIKLAPAFANRVQGPEIVRVLEGRVLPDEPAKGLLAAPVAAAPGLTVYTGEPGAVSAMQKTTLPCSEAEMTTVAFWVAVRGDRSLAVNRWEERGLSGPIDAVRAWFVKMRYADQDEQNRVTVNEAGVRFCSVWYADHAQALPHLPTSTPMEA